MEWQPIETAPKDGTRIVLWRGYSSSGVWAEMILAEWHDDAWCWPDGRENPTTHSAWHYDELMDGYCDNRNPTHWMPLPEPPKCK